MSHHSTFPGNLREHLFSIDIAMRNVARRMSYVGDDFIGKDMAG